MSEQVSVYESKMKKTLASLESELMTIRAGRANLIMEHLHRFSRLVTFLFRRLV